jgi:NAD(P)-dependent dehydrogenase (short-subunit alcohol dehydrogenase family)|tara:strand:- start:517 stop:1281 length:765 start_codon:yes stop_codon:yes gene_type:complete
MQDANGYSILITGGGSGLGAGIAQYMAKQGARLTISGRRAEKLEEVAAQIGPACSICVGDVTNAEDRARMIDTAVAHGGGLQGLANVAGNILRGPITELDPDAVLDLMNTNVVAGMALTGLATPHLEVQGGAILFIGSVHTRRAFPGASPYAATKGAVETLSQVLAAELGPKGIRVNCLLPGAVPTEINVRAGIASSTEENLARLQSMTAEHPLGRIGTPQDIAEAADYLMRAEWTTGTSVVVDGGLALGVTYK